MNYFKTNKYFLLEFFYEIGVISVPKFLFFTFCIPGTDCSRKKH